MTVAELIAELEKIPVKDIKVVYCTEYEKEVTEVTRCGDWDSWKVRLD